LSEAKEKPGEAEVKEEGQDGMDLDRRDMHTMSRITTIRRIGIIDMADMCRASATER